MGSRAESLPGRLFKMKTKQSTKRKQMQVDTIISAIGAEDPEARAERGGARCWPQSPGSGPSFPAGSSPGAPGKLPSAARAPPDRQGRPPPAGGHPPSPGERGPNARRPRLTGCPAPQVPASRRPPGTPRDGAWALGGRREARPPSQRAVGSPSSAKVTSLAPAHGHSPSQRREPGPAVAEAASSRSRRTRRRRRRRR